MKCYYASCQALITSKQLSDQVSIPVFWAMARYPGESIPGSVRELGGQDGELTFDEAVGQVAGSKTQGTRGTTHQVRSSCGNGVGPASQRPTLASAFLSIVRRTNPKIAYLSTGK